MFADIVGYTDLMQRDEALAMKKLDLFKSALEEEIPNYNGEIIQYFGDGCLATFNSALNAISCARKLQQKWGQEDEVPVRIGLHLGDVIKKDGNVYGDSVNLASRIESMGIPNSILLSESVRKSVKSQADLNFDLLGSFEFKNVSEGTNVYALQADNLTLPDAAKVTGKFAGKKPRSFSFKKWALPILVLIGLLAIGLIWLKPNLSANPPSDKVSIAVLPFTNMSDDASNEWFSIGVTEDILSHLSKIQGLRVISRTSVMQYKDTEKSIPEIARELNVAYVVEGSVRRQADQVLITAQLINADDEHVWADNYDETLLDAFKIQQEVSRRIVNQFRVYISPEEEDALSTPTTTNALALELFSKGRAIADERTKESLERSIELYEEATRLDAQFAEAYAEIANSYMLLNTYGNMPWEEAEMKANVYVEKAIKIDSNISRPYSVRAFIYLGNDWEKARINFEKAIEINPNDATAHHHFAIFWRDKPDHNEEDAQRFLEEITKAHELDPLSYPINQTKYLALLANRQFDEAKAFYEKTKYLYKKDDLVLFEALYNSGRKNDLTELINAYENGLRDDPQNQQYMYRLRTFYRGIMRDGSTSRSYSKRIAALGNNPSIYMMDSVYLLYGNKQFKAAEKLLNDSTVLTLLNPFEKIITKVDFFAFQNKFEEALQAVEGLKPMNTNDYFYNKAWIHAKQRDTSMTFQVMRDTQFRPTVNHKAYIFMNLYMTDSLYHYLQKITKDGRLIRKYIRLAAINGSLEIEPYRQDPRYIQFLKDNGFPEEAYAN